MSNPLHNLQFQVSRTPKNARFLTTFARYQLLRTVTWMLGEVSEHVQVPRSDFCNCEKKQKKRKKAKKSENFLQGSTANQTETLLQAAAALEILSISRGTALSGIGENCFRLYIARTVARSAPFPSGIPTDGPNR